MFSQELIDSLTEIRSLGRFANDVNLACANLHEFPGTKGHAMGESLVATNERYLLHLGEVTKHSAFRELSKIVLKDPWKKHPKASFHYEHLSVWSRARGGLIRFFDQTDIGDRGCFRWFLESPEDRWNLCIRDPKMGEALYSTCRAQRTAVVLARLTASSPRIRGPLAVSSALRTIMVNLRAALPELAVGALVIGVGVFAFRNQGGIWDSLTDEQKVSEA